jgi:hypothetical protein
MSETEVVAHSRCPVNVFAAHAFAGAMSYLGDVLDGESPAMQRTHNSKAIRADLGVVEFCVAPKRRANRPH